MNLKRKEIQYFLLVKKKTAVPSIWVVHVSEILNISCHGGWESETLAQSFFCGIYFLISVISARIVVIKLCIYSII